MWESESSTTLIALNAGIYNHEQKSWDKFALVELFHMRQTNSHAWIQLHLLSPSLPHPTYDAGHFPRVSSLYGDGMRGGGGGGGQKRIL